MTYGQLVFVYGSLRRGGLYHELLKDAEFLGKHVTNAAYTMLDLGDYPGVVDSGETAIVGEVYGIDNETLQRLDSLEDYPAHYERTLISTPIGEAWLYLYRMQRGNEAIVISGDWMAR